MLTTTPPTAAIPNDDEPTASELAEEERLLETSYAYSCAMRTTFTPDR